MRQARALLPVLMAGLALAALCVRPALAEDDMPPPDFPTTEFAQGADEASVTDSGITARIVMERRPEIDKELDVPVLYVEEGGRQVLEQVGVASGMEVPAASASIARMDPSSDAKSVYFSSYSGGAHCCSEVVVADRTAKGWTAVRVGSFDGDGDYLEDLDHDGIAEIVAVDNAFLYAFDCYACSAAPLVILSIRDGAVVDVSAEPRFQKNHRDWLAQLEDNADPDARWSSPGFLAGWVAQKARLGEGRDAFDQLIAHWDAKADAGEEACLTGGDIDACPRKSRKVLKFPDRLKLFLEQHGYAL